MAFEAGDGHGSAGEAAAQALDRLGEDPTGRTDALPAALPIIAPTATADPVGEALATVADHWWLQRSDGGRWVDLDVTLPGAKVGDAACPATSMAPFGWPSGPVPADLCHTVRLSVVAERWADGKLPEATVLTRTVRPGQVTGETIYAPGSPDRTVRRRST